jgi:hypothetical protein
MDRVLYGANGEVVRHFHFDPAQDGRFVLTASQDVRPYIDQNRADIAENRLGFSKSRLMRKVASIPLAFFEGWLSERGITWLQFNQMDPKEQRRQQRLCLQQNPAFRSSEGGF